MPRGAEYDDQVPQSDNPIEAGETKVHGAEGKPTSEAPREPAKKTAGLPAGMDEMNDTTLSGGGSRGIPESGSGKGGHDPKTSGEFKGTGAHKTTGIGEGDVH